MGSRSQVRVERLQGRERRAEAAGVVVGDRALRGRLRGGEGHRHGHTARACVTLRSRSSRTAISRWWSCGRSTCSSDGSRAGRRARRRAGEMHENCVPNELAGDLTFGAVS